MVGMGGDGFTNSTAAVCKFGSVLVKPKYALPPNRLYVIAPKQSSSLEQTVNVECSNDGKTFSTGVHRFAYVNV